MIFSDIPKKLEPILEKLDLLKNLLFGPDIKFARFDEERISHDPEYSSDQANAMDLKTPKALSLRAGESEVVSTNIAFEMPAGWAGLIVPKSGLGTKYEVQLVNTVGLIDSDYRGEIIVKIKMPSNENLPPMLLQEGDKFVQMIMVWAPQGRLKKVKYSKLDQTKRGEGGFGSTGR